MPQLAGTHLRAAQDTVAHLLRAQVQCVLATCSAHGSSGEERWRPATHLMAYGLCPSLASIFFATGTKTRKAEHMLRSPAVSILWDDRTGNLSDHGDGCLVTASGIAEHLAVGSDLARQLICAP